MLKSHFKWLFIFLFVLQSSNSEGKTSTDPSSLTLNERVFEKHTQKLSHLHKKNPKLLILFSGTPGMGKTFISKKLEDHFHGIRVSSDEVREILREDKIRDEKIVNDYLLWSLKKLSQVSPNHLIILDRSIDRPYETYLQFANSFGYEVFLIRLQVDRKKVEDRIHERNTSVKILLKRLNDRWNEYLLSAQNYPADYLFDNNGEDIEAKLSVLIDKIYERLDSRGKLGNIQPGSLEYERIRADILNDFPNGPDMQEIIPGLYLGNDKAVKVIDGSFTHVLCLRSNLEKPASNQIIWKGIAIADDSDEYLLPHLDKTYEFIENAQGNILVHCRHGRSRSPAVVIAYLMKKFDVPFEKAYRFVRQKKPTIDPKIGFLEELKIYEKSIRRNK